MGTSEDVKPEDVIEDQIETADEAAETGQEDAPEEFEIVRRGDEDGSQPNAPKLSGIRKRINKLNARNAASQQETTESNQALESAKAQLELQRLQIEQLREQTVKSNLPPDPNEFDEGAADPKYISALQEHTRAFVADEVRKQSATVAPAVSPIRERAQTAHYERAEKMGYADYEKDEDAVIEIIGRENMNVLIEKTDNTHFLVPYLAKRPDLAADLAELVKSDPVKGVLELGALGAQLERKSPARNRAPDPDEDLKGSTSASSTRRGPQGAVYS